MVCCSCSTVFLIWSESPALNFLFELNCRFCNADSDCLFQSFKFLIIISFSPFLFYHTGEDREWTIVRGCGYLSEQDLIHVDPKTRIHQPDCFEQKRYGKVYMKYCNCFMDECNSSFALPVNHLLMMVAALLVIFKCCWY